MPLTFEGAAVADGSLEKSAAGPPRKRGNRAQGGLPEDGCQGMEDAFLEEWAGQRDALARSLKESNPQLDGEMLAEVTQHVLNRLVFMRFLEDKLIHPENLISEFRGSGTAWPDFVAACRRLDTIYAGIVFKPHAILDAPTLKMDNAHFAGLCQKLTRVHSPYDFNRMPIHILGRIYERFLGRSGVTTGRRALLEKKPGVRKAGGVYYTPEYVVRYIVENTVGKLIADKTPRQISRMRFADIACGSGAFLLGVYHLLLDYHRAWYGAHARMARKAGCVSRDDGVWHLSLKQRREILLNNIYGVDLDGQAVEIARLSLYLKMLEEETTASARGCQLEFRETLLPALNNNIVRGNSLVGSDVSSGELLVEERKKRLDPMDYEQRFPGVMERGGFDAIVGNPPFIFTRDKGLSPLEKDYFHKRYQHQSAQLNMFGLFLERSHGLLKRNGWLGYITPNNWLTIESFASLRRFLLTKTADLSVVNILDKVFDSADVDTAITLFARGKPATVTLAEMRGRKITFSRAVAVDEIKPPAFLFQIGWLKQPRSRELLEKITGVARPLSDFATVSTGLKVYQAGKGAPPQTNKEKNARVFHSDTKKSETCGRYLAGADVGRYRLSWSGEYLNYGNWIAEPRRSVPFDGERLLIRQIPSKPPYLIHTVLTNEPFYHDINSMVVFGPTGQTQLKYILGVINSALLSFWFEKTYDKLQRRIFPQFKVKELAQFPIRAIDFANRADKTSHDKMVSLVERMLAAKKQPAHARGGECDSLDRQMDALVYQLYGLTDEERQIVRSGGA